MKTSLVAKSWRKEELYERGAVPADGARSRDKRLTVSPKSESYGEHVSIGCNGYEVGQLDRVRKLPPHSVVELQIIDNEIEKLRELMDAQWDRMQKVLKEGFAEGKPITMKEAKAWAAGWKSAALSTQNLKQPQH